MKEFGLHFRFRDAENTLHDAGLVTTATSQKAAKQTGKNLERPQDKVWFLRLITPDEARGIGRQLP